MTEITKLNKPRIMVVESDDTLRLAYVKLLEYAGIEVVPVECVLGVKNALAICPENSFDACITAVNLGAYGGGATAGLHVKNMVHRHSPDALVCFNCAYSQADQRNNDDRTIHFQQNQPLDDIVDFVLKAVLLPEERSSAIRLHRDINYRLLATFKAA